MSLPITPGYYTDVVSDHRRKGCTEPGSLSNLRRQKSKFKDAMVARISGVKYQRGETAERS